MKRKRETVNTKQPPHAKSNSRNTQYVSGFVSPRISAKTPP